MEEPVSPDTFAHGLSDRMLACRELGHVWRPFTVEVIRERRRVGGYLRVMRCSQCKTERHQLLDSFGAVIQNGYHYTAGYLADNVQKGFSRDTFRLESVTRWLDKHPAAEDDPDRKAS